jgi:hypothetical protein
MCSQPRPSEAIFSRKFFGSLYCHSKTCHPFIATQKYVIPSLPSVYILRSLQCHSVNSVGNGVWRSSCTRRQGAVTIRTSRARDVVRTGTAKRAPLPPPRLRTPWPAVALAGTAVGGAARLRQRRGGDGHHGGRRGSGKLWRDRLEAKNVAAQIVQRRCPILGVCPEAGGGTCTAARTPGAPSVGKQSQDCMEVHSRTSL